MKKITMILALLVLFTSANAATNSIKQKTALKMLNVMNKNRLLDRHINSMIKMEVAGNPLLSMKQKEVTRFFHRYASFSKLKSELARIYTRELTIKEMQQFTAFFDTSVGQKMILKMPRLIGLSSNLAQKKIQERYPELINTFLRR
ncbi:MAG TPA: DUF2059 domain-containing protein [Campylobacterales bacterium]|nr:DUF2059 domain-containing protein [Campylobacterales bacterium]